MKISINQPCHENWDNMLPDEKGAFCLVCQKNVVDFSGKTLAQIKDFFNTKKEAEAVCGRFEERQLRALDFDDFFARFVNLKFVQKLALIFFFVFGMNLFGQAQTKPKPNPKPPVQEPMIMGDIAYIPVDTTKKVGLKDTLYENQVITGKIKYLPEKPKKQPQRSRKIMGEPEVEPKGLR